MEASNDRLNSSASARRRSSASRSARCSAIERSTSAQMAASSSGDTGFWVSSICTTRSRSPWRWAVGGAAVGAVGAVLVFAPASWLAAGLAQASAERVRLLDPRGTVWQGSGLLQLTGGAGSDNTSAVALRFLGK